MGSLIDKLFPGKRDPDRQVYEYFKTLTAYQPVYTTFEGGIYEMELTRAAVAAFARHVSKLRPQVMGSLRPDLQPILDIQPSPYMDTSKFLARIGTIFEVQNNAFLVPIENRFGEVTGFFPALPNRASIVDHEGVQYLRYQFSNGQNAAIELSRTGLMVQHQYKDDFFGENNGCMMPVLQMMHTQDEGIINAIKNATTIRFMARMAGNLKKKDLDEQRKLFTQMNLSAENQTGVMIFDSKFSDIKQVESTAIVVDTEQQKSIRESVFYHFGTNDKILTNVFDEDSWAAYYEGKVEPFALQLSQVLTRMVFSLDEIAQGNMILFSANRMQYASSQTKLEVVTQLFDRGFMTHNQGLEIFNMPPIGPEGDKYYIRKEYSEVSKLDTVTEE